MEIPSEDDGACSTTFQFKEDKEAHTTSVKNIAADLDICLQDILFWESTITRLDAEVIELNAQYKALNGKFELLKSLNSTDVQKISNLQETINELQESLKKKTIDESEMKSLQEQLIMLQDQTNNAEDKLKEGNLKFEKLSKVQQNKHDEEIQRLKQQMDNENKLKFEDYKSSLKEMRKCLEEEHNKRQEMEKNHESEIVKMQMEYESKIALIQAQNSRLQSSCNNSNFISNDVFRKKLQHIQEESSKEINKLKQEVSALRLQSGAIFENNETIQPNHGRSGILKRKRC